LLSVSTPNVFTSHSANFDALCAFVASGLSSSSPCGSPSATANARRRRLRASIHFFDSAARSPACA
jgi:hypothetical protein